MPPHGKGKTKNAPMARFLLYLYYITHANVALAFFNMNQPIR